jgi:hypothetical protein
VAAATDALNTPAERIQLLAIRSVGAGGARRHNAGSRRRKYRREPASCSDALTRWRRQQRSWVQAPALI